MLPFILIGSLELSTYWVMVGIGAVGMLICLLYRRNDHKLTKPKCVIFTLILTGSGIVGAKLLYILENFETILRDGLSLGGVSFFGSVYLILVLMPLIGRFFGLQSAQTLDVCAPCVAIMIACIRIGCFLSGCCGADAIIVNGREVIPPVQLLEVAWDAYLAWLLLKSERFSARDGMGYPIFMVGYSGFRFFHEFLRNTPKVVGFLSIGHWYAIITVMIGLAWYSAQSAMKEKKRRRG